MNAFFGTSIDITQRAHCIWPVGLQLLAQSVVTRFSCLFSPRRYSSRERSSSFVTSWFTERKKKSIELRKKNVKTESKIPISTNLRSYLNKNSTRNKGRIQVIVLDDQGWRRRGRSSFYADGYAEVVRFSVRSKLCEGGGTNSSITRHARVPHISYPVRLGAALVRWWTINHEFYRPFHPRAFTGNGAILFLHSIQSRRRLDGLKSCTDRRMFERCEHPPGVFWDNINARNSKFSPRLKQTDERKWERERKEFDFRCHDIYMYNFRSRVCVKGRGKFDLSFETSNF